MHIHHAFYSLVAGASLFGTGMARMCTPKPRPSYSSDVSLESTSTPWSVSFTDDSYLGFFSTSASEGSTTPIMDAVPSESATSLSTDAAGDLSITTSDITTTTALEPQSTTATSTTTDIVSSTTSDIASTAISNMTPSTSSEIAPTTLVDSIYATALDTTTPAILDVPSTTTVVSSTANSDITPTTSDIASTTSSDVTSTTIGATLTRVPDTTSTAILDITSITTSETTSTTTSRAPAPTFQLIAGVAVNAASSGHYLYSRLPTYDADTRNLMFSSSVDNYAMRQFTIEDGTNRLMIAGTNTYILTGTSSSTYRVYTGFASRVGTPTTAYTWTFIQCAAPSQGQPLQCQLETGGVSISWVVQKTSPDPGLLMTTSSNIASVYEVIDLYFG